MKIIPLSSFAKCKNFGKYFTTVSDEDYELLNQYKWQAQENKYGAVYAVSSIGGKMIKMHRLIMGVSDPSISIDHANGNTLCNERFNLRIATNSQQAQNRKQFSCSSSTYKGVHVSKERKDRKTTNISDEYYISYRVRIRVGGKKINIGSFKNEIDAAKAYDKAARQHFGEFARVNFPTL